MTVVDLSPLQGYTVAVTAARRSEELGQLLERRGARVLYAPAIKIVPLLDDSELRRATEECISTPIDFAIATTAIGWRGWMEAADGWGLGEQLRGRLEQSRILARGPKVTGAVRAADLSEEWSPAGESMREVLKHVLNEGVTGKRVIVQLHGEPLPDLVKSLVDAGADVLSVPVYRWTLPDDIAPVERLVASMLSGSVNAITFTSAPAVLGVLSVAERLGQRDDLIAAMAHDVVAACVGPVCSAPLDRLDVPTITPARFRLGNLVRTVAEEVPRRLDRIVEVGGHQVKLRGHVVILDGVPVEVPPTPLAILRALTQQPGKVYSRVELAPLLSDDCAGPHAVEMAVTRLRALLGANDIVQTVVKRGYRLAVA